MRKKNDNSYRKGWLLKTFEDLIAQTSELTLLFVDDNEVARETTYELLKEFFREVIVAVDGHDGLEKFRRYPVDIVLTDIRMSGMDGIEMTALIREIDHDVAVIVLTAHTEPDYLQQGIRLGIDGYLNKPIEIDIFLDVLSHAVSQTLLQTERKRHALENERHANYLRSIIASIQDPIMVVGDDYRIELLNDFPLLPDAAGEKKAVQTCYHLLHGLGAPCDPAVRLCPLRVMRQKPGSIRVRHECRGGNRTHRFEIQASPLLDEDGRFTGFVGTAREISHHLTLQQKLEEEKEKLSHQAQHDNLTQLANRTLFDTRLAEAIRQADDRQHKVALLFIDLNKFKAINDTLGHQAGDKVLQQVSRVMRNTLRKGDTLARVGGDEFALIAPDITHIDESLSIARKLLSALQGSLTVDGQDIPLSASIGIAHYPDDSRDVSTLLSLADEAMYRAKSHPEHIVSYQG